MDKRLTYRTEDGWVGVNDQTNGVVSTNSQAVHRLADIEDIMEKIKKYIENFLKHNTMNIRYGMYYNEIVSCINALEESQPSTICTIFDYGYAKGYRAAMAEMKKASNA